MPFVQVKGLPGKVYVPECKNAPGKHPCPDCLCCQRCSDDRCQICTAESKGSPADGKATPKERAPRE